MQFFDYLAGPNLRPTMTSTDDKTTQGNWYPPWAPRFWSGMAFGDYVSLLRENKFQIHPYKYPMTALVGGTSIINSCCAAVQRLFLNKKIADTLSLIHI